MIINMQGEKNKVRFVEFNCCFAERGQSLVFRKNPLKSMILTKMLKKKTLRRESPHTKSSILLTNDFETEVILLPGLIQVTVSTSLYQLLKQIISTYPNCKITQDPSQSPINVHRYLYDINQKSIKSLNDLEKNPSELMISCRHNVVYQHHIENYKTKNTKIGVIDMYGNVIDKGECTRKVFKSEKFVLRKVQSERKIRKSFGAQELHTAKWLGSIELGNNGRSQMGIGKSWNIDERHLEKISNFQYKCVENIDDICLKNSITREEYKTMINNYKFLKGNKRFLSVHTVAKAFSMSPSIFKGLSDKRLIPKTLSWPEFLMFYVTVHLQRRNFSENLKFLTNCLIIPSSTISLPDSTSQNLYFTTILNKILSFFQSNPSFLTLPPTDSSKLFQSQNENISNADLKLLISYLSTVNN